MADEDDWSTRDWSTIDLNPIPSININKDESVSVEKVSKQAPTKQEQQKKEQPKQQMHLTTLTKVQQQEQQIKTDMIAAANTFGFIIEPEISTFEYTKIAQNLAKQLIDTYQTDFHYNHIVTELTKELSDPLSLENLSHLISSLEVLKNIKISNIKKKKPAQVKKVTMKCDSSVVREDYIESEYDNFM